MKLDKQQNAVIISHFHIRAERGGGPPQDIKDYLLDKINTLCYIELPFVYANNQTAYCSIYNNGKLSKQYSVRLIKVPELLVYLEHLIIINYFILKLKYKYHFALALDNLSVISIYLLKIAKIIDKIIYYSIDYTPRRFDSNLLNFVYHKADKIACNISDKNWMVTKSMIIAREKTGINVNNSKFIVVPIGFHAERLKLKHSSKVNRFKLVYMGSIAQKQGIQMIINSLPSLLSNFPKIELTIIGGGDYLSVLRRKVTNLGLNKIVTFTGFINKHKEMEHMLLSSGVGIATYMPVKNSFTYYADPGKIKQYLGCGLPVVTTSVPSIARNIKLRKAGVVVTYNRDGITKGIGMLLESKKGYNKYRESAINYSRQFDINSIMSIAFKKTL